MTQLDKLSILTSLIHRARSLCDQESLPSELEFLTTVFKNNGYNQPLIERALLPWRIAIKNKIKPTATALLPYTQTTFGRLSRMLSNYNIKSVALSPRKISNFLPPFKEALGLRIPGIYGIPCECGKVHVGQSGRTIQHRIQEQGRHRAAGPFNIAYKNTADIERPDHSTSHTRTRQTY